jgi:hypothetical protein
MYCSCYSNTEVLHSAIMIVVHFTKVSVLYIRVVISSLYEQLENLIFIILTFSLVYGSNITTCRYYKKRD